MRDDVIERLDDQARELPRGTALLNRIADESRAHWDGCRYVALGAKARAELRWIAHEYRKAPRSTDALLQAFEAELQSQGWSAEQAAVALTIVGQFVAFAARPESEPLSEE